MIPIPNSPRRRRVATVHRHNADEPRSSLLFVGRCTIPSLGTLTTEMLVKMGWSNA